MGSAAVTKRSRFRKIHWWAMSDEEGVISGCCGGEEWCAVTCTTDVLSRKWHSIIVHKLLYHEALGFNDLKSRIEGISSKVLSESLDDLVDKGIVEREVLQEDPRRVEYTLTKAGEDLRPVIEALGAWGREHLDPGRPIPRGLEGSLG